MRKWFGHLLVLVGCLLSGCKAPEISRPAQTDLTPPEGMVLVPAGPCIIGSDEGQVNERPQLKGELPAFFIDKHEVSNEEYARFLAATGRVPPPGWTERRPPKGMARLPVVNVTLYDAMAYAAWAGKRLPTEAEWEKAARGPDGRLYPWGDRWDPNMGAASTELRSVDSFPEAASPYGCLGMVGNAREWTISPYTLIRRSEPDNPLAYLFAGIQIRLSQAFKTDFGNKVTKLESMSGGPTTTLIGDAAMVWRWRCSYAEATRAAQDNPNLLRVVKGGPGNAWFRTAFECRASFREGLAPMTRDKTLGFRCARDVL